MASTKRRTLYVGVTNDLVRRIWQHKHHVFQGFTHEYGVHRLVYFEEHDGIREAILREKQLKKWNRAWKLRLIDEMNPNWDDLYGRIAGSWDGSPPAR